MKNKDKTATKIKTKRKYKLVGEQPCSMNVMVVDHHIRTK